MDFGQCHPDRIHLNRRRRSSFFRSCFSRRLIVQTNFGYFLQMRASLLLFLCYSRTLPAQLEAAPRMGWNSRNAYGLNIDDPTVRPARWPWLGTVSRAQLSVRRDRRKLGRRPGFKWEYQSPTASFPTWPPWRPESDPTKRRRAILWIYYRIYRGSRHGQFLTGTSDQNYRKRLNQRGMSRFEVLGLDADRELIRALAKRLADICPDSAQIRATVRRTISGEPPKKGGILNALPRSPLVGADLNLNRPVTADRKVDL